MQLRAIQAKQPWHVAFGAVLACAPAVQGGTTNAGSSGESVHVIRERTDHLTLPPGEQLSPDPGTEAALRRHIESFQRRAPNYQDMVPEMADVSRSQPGSADSIAELGELRGIVFKGKGPQGASLFEVTTSKGVSHWGIHLNAEGKTDGLFFEEEPPASVPSEPELLRELEARLDRATAANAFSGVVLLARNGKAIFQAARGLADRERERKVGMTTKFRIGSMNKMFTAVAVLKLREQGKLALEDTLAKWLPDYPNQELARTVTLHQLLTHTGGTGDIFGPLYRAHRQEFTGHQAYIDVYGERGLEFVPGARFAYSNYGYVLLGRVIEKASGESYYDYVEKHVYALARMTATGSEPESQAVSERSIGYRRGPEGLTPNVDFLPPRGMAAGIGYSTAEDLLRFANALESHTLLSKETTQLLLAGKVRSGPRGKYAYGFVERSYRRIHTIGHNGGAPGMNSHFEMLPGSGHVVIVLANLDPPAAEDIANFVVERLPRTESSAAAGNAPLVAQRPAPASSGLLRGTNLIENGDFAQGDALWATLLWPPLAAPRPIDSRVERGALCASVPGGQNVILSWAPDPPKALELRQGQRYRLSFRASAIGPLAVRAVAKVGHQVPPYTPAVQAPIPVHAKPQAFAIDFDPAHADPKASVAFVFSAPRGDAQNDVCVDDVSLVGGGPG